MTSAWPRPGNVSPSTYSPPAFRGHRVGLGQHLAGGQQVADLDVGGRRRGVGEQDEQIEEVAGRALGQEPAGRRGRDAGAGVTGRKHLAAAAAVHRALDEDRLRRRDGRGHVGVRELGRLGVDRQCHPRVWRQRVGALDRRERRRPQVAHRRGHSGVTRVLEQVEQREGIRWRLRPGTTTWRARRWPARRARRDLVVPQLIVRSLISGTLE